MLFIGTENNGFAHAVGIHQVGGDLLRHLANTILEYDIIIVVGIIVDAILYLISIDIALTSGGSPFGADVGGDVDHPEGGEEAIIDALLEAIGIDRLAKVGNRGLVLCLFGGGGHTELCCSLEVLEDHFPRAIITSTASMALIDDDQVEEVGLEELLILWLIILSYHLLIEGEVDFVGCPAGVLDILLIIDLVGGIGEWLEVLLY